MAGKMRACSGSSKDPALSLLEERVLLPALLFARV